MTERLPHTMNPVQDGVILVTSYSLRLGYPLSMHSLRNKCEAQWGVVGPSSSPPAVEGIEILPLPRVGWRRNLEHEA